MSQIYDQSSDPAYNEIYGSSLSLPAFDSASTDYRQNQHAAYIADADQLAVNELLLIQARSRDAARNNEIAFSAESKLVTKLGAVEVDWLTIGSKEKHPLMQELWDEFAANPNKDGFGDLKVTQTVWNHDRIQSGEAISHMVLVTKNNNNRVKLKLINIESEYLDITNQGVTPTDNTRYGITFADSIPTYYNFLPERRYGIQDITANNINYVKIPAEDIIHIFERRRSNQWRGIPIIASMLTAIYEITDLTQATVSKQKAAAAISWIIEQANAYDVNSLGSVKTAGKSSQNDVEKKMFFAINGGSVQYTNPGDKFNLVQSSDIGNNLMGLIKHVLQKSAANYGLPYYMLSGDTSGLDFSSIRGILIEFRDYLEYVHNIINLPSGLSKVTKRFKELASFSYAVEDAIPVYRFPRNYGVDELKDAQADLLELQLGATTLERIQGERGVTMEEVLASREKMKANKLEEILTPKTASSSQNTNIKPNSNTTGS